MDYFKPLNREQLKEVLTQFQKESDEWTTFEQSIEDEHLAFSPSRNKRTILQESRGLPQYYLNGSPRYLEGESRTAISFAEADLAFQDAVACSKIYRYTDKYLKNFLETFKTFRDFYDGDLRFYSYPTDFNKIRSQVPFEDLEIHQQLHRSYSILVKLRDLAHNGNLEENFPLFGETFIPKKEISLYGGYGEKPNMADLFQSVGEEMHSLVKTISLAIEKAPVSATEKTPQEENSLVVKPGPNSMRMVEEELRAELADHPEEFQSCPKEGGFFHKTAFVDESVAVPFGSIIGPNAHIMAGVKIGENVMVGQESTVYERARLGDNTILGHHVTIGYATQIGTAGVSPLQGEGIRDYTYIHDEAVIGNRALVGINVQFFGQSMGDESQIMNPRPLDSKLIVGNGTVVGKGVRIESSIGNECKISDGAIIQGKPRYELKEGAQVERRAVLDCNKWWDRCFHFKSIFSGSHGMEVTAPTITTQPRVSLRHQLPDGNSQKKVEGTNQPENNPALRN